MYMFSEQTSFNNKILIANTSVGMENEKVPSSSVPASELSTAVSPFHVEYLKSLNKPNWKITIQEYFLPAFKSGFRLTNSIPKECQNTLIKLLDTVNSVRLEFGKPLTVSSGYRSPEHNIKIGGSKNSAHCTYEAIDLLDKSGDLRRFCMANDCAILKKYGLYMESPVYTKGWCHLTTRVPASGNRIFIPYAGKIKSKHYDSSFKV
jgi:hypothetical protein